MLVARLTTQYSSLGLILTSCLAGIAYYLGVAVVTGPVLLIALQVLNAWCFAGIGGVGLTLFQQMIRRPGLSTGLYMNTRRVGAILSGPLIALGGATALGQRATFLACAVLTLVGLLIIAAAGRRSRREEEAVAPGWLRRVTRRAAAPLEQVAAASRSPVRPVGEVVPLAGDR